MALSDNCGFFVFFLTEKRSPFVVANLITATRKMKIGSCWQTHNTENITQSVRWLTLPQNKVHNLGKVDFILDIINFSGIDQSRRNSNINISPQSIFLFQCSQPWQGNADTNSSLTVAFLFRSFAFLRCVSVIFYLILHFNRYFFTWKCL